MSASTSRSRGVSAERESRPPASSRATPAGSSADPPAATPGSPAGRDELDREPGLDVLGQQEYPHLGGAPAHLGRDLGPVVRVVRGHPNVEHRDVGPVLEDGG